MPAVGRLYNEGLQSERRLILLMTAEQNPQLDMEVDRLTRKDVVEITIRDGGNSGFDFPKESQGDRRAA